MPDSVSEQLQRDIACEGLLACFHGLRRLDRAVFEALLAAEEPLTVDETANTVDRERPTAYRAVQRLLQSGVIQKEQVNYDQGGYYHVYAPTDPSKIADEMVRIRNDWYAKMGQVTYPTLLRSPTRGSLVARSDGQRTLRFLTT